MQSHLLKTDPSISTAMMILTAVIERKQPSIRSGRESIVSENDIPVSEQCIILMPVTVPLCAKQIIKNVLQCDWISRGIFHKSDQVMLPELACMSRMKLKSLSCVPRTSCISENGVWTSWMEREKLSDIIDTVAICHQPTRIS